MRNKPIAKYVGDGDSGTTNESVITLTTKQPADMHVINDYRSRPYYIEFPDNWRQIYSPVMNADNGDC